MILRALIFCLVLTLLPWVACSAQDKIAAKDFLTDTWQTPQGLPENLVSCILQTRDGYLWVGTYGGLARFDGIRFVTFGVHNTKGFRHNRITSLLEDRAGDLWIGSDGGGVTRYHDGQFVNYGIQDGLVSDSVYLIGQAAGDGVYMTDYTGRFNRSQNGKIVTCSMKDLPENLRPGRNLQTDATGQVWITLSNIPNCLVPRSLTQIGPLSEVRQDRSGNFWILGQGYIARLRPGNQSREAIPDPLLKDDFTCFFESRSGDFWVGTLRHGLLHWKQGQGSSFEPVDGVPDVEVRTLCEDHEGDLWVGTTRGGLTRLRPRPIEVHSEGLIGKDVLTVVEAPSRRLWVGTYETGLYYTEPNSSNHFYPLSGPFDNSGIWSLCSTWNGDLWVGTWGGLYRIKDTQVIRFGGLSDNDVQALYEDRDRSLWIGTHSGGLGHFDGTNLTTLGPKEGLSGKYLTSIIRTRDGTLWVGSNGGGVFRMANGKFSGYSIKDGLSSSIVLVLHEDSEGRLWLGTQGDGGLTLWDGHRFFNFTRSMGLPADAVKEILEDSDGNLWLGSNCGIIRASKDELSELAEGKITWLHAMSYGEKDGLPNVECRGGTQPAACKTSDGKLWFATHEGLVAVDPRRIYANASPPSVIIEEVQAGTQRFKPIVQQAPALPTIKLPPSERAFQIRYTALSLAVPEKVQFKYRLEGIDQDWIEAGERRIATYQHLPPGRFHFQVIACSDCGTWNSVGASLAITCLPSFWETRWFLSFTIFSAAAAIAASVRFVTHRRMLQKVERLERQRAMEQERTRIARDIHDEVGSSLTKINKLAELLNLQAESAGQFNPSFNNIADTASKTIQAMDEIVWAVNPKNDTLDEMATYLVYFAREFLRTTTVASDFDVPLTLPNLPVSAEVRHNLLMAVKEALNNAVKHAKANEIRLSLNLTDNVLTIEVKDDGEGFVLAGTETSGNGLEIMRKRLGAINGEFVLKSAPGHGTVVRISLKLVPNAPKPPRIQME
jgi:ligand-binding sensor domain-containing protein/two-component sensor histidine kinase